MSSAKPARGFSAAAVSAKSEPISASRSLAIDRERVRGCDRTRDATGGTGDGGDCIQVRGLGVVECGQRGGECAHVLDRAHWRRGVLAYGVPAAAEADAGLVKQWFERIWE